MRSACWLTKYWIEDAGALRCRLGIRLAIPGNRSDYEGMKITSPPLDPSNHPRTKFRRETWETATLTLLIATAWVIAWAIGEVIYGLTVRVILWAIGGTDAIGDAITLPIGSKDQSAVIIWTLALAIGGVIGLALSGLLTGWALHVVELPIQWHKIFVLAVGWAIAFFISWAIAGAIGKAIADAETVHSLSDASRTIWSISRVCAGAISLAIGGLFVGGILHVAEPSIRWHKIFILVVGWVIAWVISLIVVWAVGEATSFVFHVTAQSVTNVGPLPVGAASSSVITARSGETIVKAIAAVIPSAIGGAIGGLVTGWALPVAEPPIRRRQIFFLAAGWAMAVAFPAAMSTVSAIPGIPGACAGAIGGLVTGWVLRIAKPSIHWQLILWLAAGWAIIDVASVIIGGTMFAVISGAIRGLVTGWALRIVEPSFQPRQMFLLVGGWAIAWVVAWAMGGAGGKAVDWTIALAIAVAIAVAIHGLVTEWASRIAEPLIQRWQIFFLAVGLAIAWLFIWDDGMYEPLAVAIAWALYWAMPVATNLAIGGVITGWVIRIVEPSIQPTQVSLLVVGWIIAWSIGWIAAFIVAIIDVAIAVAIDEAIGRAIVGGICGLVTGLALPVADPPFKWRQVVLLAAGCATIWVIVGAMGVGIDDSFMSVAFAWAIAGAIIGRHTLLCINEARVGCAEVRSASVE